MNLGKEPKNQKEMIDHYMLTNTAAGNNPRLSLTKKGGTNAKKR